MDMTIATSAGSGVAATPRRGWTAWAALALIALVLVGCDSVEERAENHFQSGMALLAEGDPVKATLEFRNALKLNDNHVGANLELGKIFEAEGNASGALHQYQRVVSLDATQYEAHVSLAKILLGAGQVEQAASSIATAAQLRPGEYEVLILEATLAMRTGNLALAQERVDLAIEAQPDNGDAWIVQAAISRRQNDAEKSLAQVEEGLRRDPDNTRAMLFRLNLLGELEREADIGPALRRLIEARPDEISFHDSLVRWQLRNGEYEAAEETLRRLSELAPDDTARALDIVRLIARTEGREAAIRELARLIEARRGTPVERMLTLAMAEIEVEDRQLDAAGDRLAALIEAKGDDDIATGARNLLARLRLNAGDRGSAETLINAVLASDPTNSTALALRGRMHILAEDYDAAIRDLRAAEAEAPEDVETLQLLALAHQRNGSTDLAGERLAAAVEASDYAVPQVLGYAQFLMRQDKVDFAEDLVSDTLARRPGNLQLIDALARIKLAQRDYAGVEAIARALADAGDGTGLADRLLAAALAGQERYDETIGILEAAGQEEGRANAYLSALVATHLRNDDLEAAEAVVEKALAEEPENADAIRLKATLAMVRDAPDEARPLFEQAVALRPESASNYLALFRFHLDQRDTGAAVAVLDDGIEATGNPALLLNRAMMRERAGDIDGAIADYEVIYAAQPGSELVANNLASLITDNDPSAEDIERAYTIARRLRDTEVPQFKDTYGWLLYLRGDPRAARPVLEEARAQLADNPIVQYHLGVVLADLGETDAAREALSRAIELAGGRTIPQIAGAQARLDGLGATTQQ